MGSVAQVKKYRRLASLIALRRSSLGAKQRSPPMVPKMWNIPASKKMIKFRIIEIGALDEGRGETGGDKWHAWGTEKGRRARRQRPHTHSDLNAQHAQKVLHTSTAWKMMMAAITPSAALVYVVICVSKPLSVMLPRLLATEPFTLVMPSLAAPMEEAPPFSALVRALIRVAMVGCVQWKAPGHAV